MGKKKSWYNSHLQIVNTIYNFLIYFCYSFNIWSNQFQISFVTEYKYSIQLYNLKLDLPMILDYGIIASTLLALWLHMFQMVLQQRS